MNDSHRAPGLIQSANVQELKVLLLPNNTASDLSHKVRALRNIGINARGLAIGGHQVQSAEGLEMVPLVQGQYLRNRIKRLAFIKQLTSGIRWADIIHWVWDLGVLPCKLDKRILQLSGKPGVVEWLGSDIRDPAIDLTVNPHYRVAQREGYEYTQESTERSSRAQRDFAELGFFPLEFIGMGHYINESLFPKRYRTWQSITLAEHEPRFPDPKIRRPLVVHSPTAPVAKGTKYIIAAVEKLKEKFDFDFRLVVDVPRPEALKIMSACDIFVDQLIVGGHGFAAVEAMASGKPVLCYINPVIGRDYPPDLPIVNTDPSNITDQLNNLLASGELRHELGRRGRAYVEKYHCDEKIAHELVAAYREVMDLQRQKKNARSLD
jgi:glycosyltransferase involved in cell wall biosynthesis